MALKAKDVREYVHTLGFERGIVRSLEGLIEEHAQTRRDLQELGSIMSGMADQLQVAVNVYTDVQQAVEKLKNRSEAAHAELGVSTHALGVED